MKMQQYFCLLFVVTSAHALKQEIRMAPVVSYAGKTIVRGSLAGRSLRGVDATGAVFRRVEFPSVKANGAIFSEAKFYNCGMQYMVLDPAKLGQRTQLNHVEIYDSDLTGIQAMDARFDHATLKRLNCTGALFHRTRFWNATIEDVDFSGANLMEADFSGSKFTRTDLLKAKDVTGTILLNVRGISIKDLQKLSKRDAITTRKQLKDYRKKHPESYA